MHDIETRRGIKFPRTGEELGIILRIIAAYRWRWFDRDVVTAEKKSEAMPFASVRRYARVFLALVVVLAAGIAVGSLYREHSRQAALVTYRLKEQARLLQLAADHDRKAAMAKRLENSLLTLDMSHEEETFAMGTIAELRKVQGGQFDIEQFPALMRREEARQRMAGQVCRRAARMYEGGKIRGLK